MTKPHAFQCRDHMTCSTCFDFGSNKGVRYCRTNQRRICYDPTRFGCGEYGAGFEHPEVPVITAELILSGDGWLGTSPCCFQCRHADPRYHGPHERREEPDGSGTIVEDEIRIYRRTCSRNPLALNIYGDTRQCCGLFELNTNRWHSLRIQAFEWENQLRRAKANHGQMTLEEYA